MRRLPAFVLAAALPLGGPSARAEDPLPPHFTEETATAGIDATFTPLLITPPFPEYPSGHSTQSGAAAAVLTQAFGENFAYDDASHVRDGLPPRHFASFAAAAEEAALSRLYGGIHFRWAIEQGLVQGRCVGRYANALKTRP